MTRGRARALQLAIGIVVSLLAGCATHTAKLTTLRPLLMEEHHDEALALVDEELGDKDALLADLERGLILHDAGRYEESNAVFTAAERRAKDLEAISLTEGPLSLVTNDLARSYRARPFEMAMIPYYRSLNYLRLGAREGAMVEARKASLLLRDAVDGTLGRDGHGVQGLAFERTRDDPFLLYYSGMLYDWDGELNDAFIAYRNAAVAYQDIGNLVGIGIPPSLAGDLERTGRRLGFGAELDELRALCPEVFAAAATSGADGRWPAGTGEVVLLVETGWVATKGQVELSLPILKSDEFDSRDDWAWTLASRSEYRRGYYRQSQVAYWLQVALPTMAPPEVADHRLVVHVTGHGSTGSTLVHRPSALAGITFEAEYGTILFRTVLRALVKYLTYTAANKQSSGLGFLMNLFNAVSEVADTRSWLTLPDQIQLVRLQLPAGVHDLELAWSDPQGRALGHATIPQVTVRAGDWTFVGHRVFVD